MTIQPEDGYLYDDARVVVFNKEDVIESLGSAPVVGDPLLMVTTTGEVVEGIVTEIGDETITIDFNSQLVGHVLVFDITVVDIVKGKGGH